MSKSYTRSFAGGEIGPGLYGRLDLAKFQTGLAKCLNFIVTPQGPIENRAGFEKVNKARNDGASSVLIPFVYNADQAYALEFGPQYIRFHTQGAPLLEASKSITAISQAASGVFEVAGHGWAVGEWVYLASIGGMTQLSGLMGIITATTVDTFQLKTVLDVMVDTSGLSAYTGGGTASRVYEIPTPYAQADLYDLHFVQSADVLTITHQGYATRELRRLGATNWTLTVPTFSPTVETPGTPSVSAGGPGGGSPDDHTYVTTAVLAETLEESLASAEATVSNDLSVSGNHNDIQPAVVSGAIRYNVYKRKSGIFGFIGQTDGAVFRDENIEADTSQTPPLPANPFVVGAISAVEVTAGGSGYGTVSSGGEITSVTVTAGGSGYTSATASASGGGSGATFTVNLNGLGSVSTIDIDTPGSLYVSPTIAISGDGTGATATATASPVTSEVVLTVTDGAGTGSGAEVEAVISGGVITGVRIINAGSGYGSPAITVTTASGGSGATFSITTTGENVYPQAVSYFDQRRCFGGSALLPQHVWATRSGTESNMTYSIPTQDDDAITARIVAREANVVRHLVPLNDLLALTSGGVWRLSPASEEPLTPASISPKQHSGIGASMVQPVITSYSVIYVPDRGAHVRELAYKWETQRYHSDDVAVLAPHLFDFKTIVQLAYSRAPTQILWAVRSDGVLLGMTHQPEHEVKAWHKHDTQGWFESVCVIPEGDEDGVYVVVHRLIDGQTRRFIERMHTRQFATVADAFFLDCAVTYEGSPATIISGLHHLEGEEVAILADGGVHPARTVSSGAIELDVAASKVHVGLPYNADAQTLPLAMEVEAFAQGVEKNISEVFLRVLDSSGISAGPSFDAADLMQYAPRTADDDYGDPPALVSGMVSLKITPTWQRDGAICIRQADPLPLTLQSMTLDLARGG